MKTLPIQWNKLKYGIGQGGYIDQQFVGLVKQDEKNPKLFWVVCPFKRFKDPFNSIEEGKKALLRQFKTFMDAVTGLNVTIG